MRIRGKFGLMLVAMVAVWATSAVAGDDDKVARMWKSKCGSCHGVDGKADTKQGKKMGIGDMSTAAWQTEFTDEKIRKAITDGLSREKNGKQQDMDPLGKELEPAQIDALIKYARGLKK